MVVFSYAVYSESKYIMNLEQMPKDNVEQVQAEGLSEELDDSQLKTVAGGNSKSTSDPVNPPAEVPSPSLKNYS